MNVADMAIEEKGQGEARPARIGLRVVPTLKLIEPENVSSQIIQAGLATWISKRGI
jgi:hypothetical protein